MEGLRPNKRNTKKILLQYASAAIPVPEEEWSKYPNKETKWIEGVNYTREKSERESKKQEIEENRARNHRLNLQRRTETEMQNREQIQIPIPSYSYGAIRRERFAFGRITNAQAKANTMRQRASYENEAKEPNATEQFAEQEEEDNFFLAQEPPSMSDCA